MIRIGFEKFFKIYTVPEKYLNLTFDWEVLEYEVKVLAVHEIFLLDSKMSLILSE